MKGEVLKNPLSMKGEILKNVQNVMSCIFGLITRCGHSTSAEIEIFISVKLILFSVVGITAVLKAAERQN